MGRIDSTRNKQLQADMMLVILTFGWGVSYYMMDICLQEMDPLTLNAYRFLGAFIVAALLSFKKIINVNRQTLKYALLVSIALVGVYLGATYGVKYTTQSNAGFFCATSTIFTPVMAYFFKKVIPEKKLIVVIIMCTIGIGLMSLDAHMKIAIGDLMCLGCGIMYAIDLLLTESAVAKEEVNAFQLGVFQLGFTGLWMLILAVIFETPVLPQSGGCWMSVIFLTIFCTGVAFIVQPIAQQHTTATHVGIIFSLEPVFAGIVAFAFAGERLLLRAYIGMALMLVSLLMMELDLKGFGRRKNSCEDSQ